MAFRDTFIGALKLAANENVGTYAIGQNTLSLGPNYLLSFVGDDFTIAQRPVTVTVDAGQHKTYGASDPAAFTYSITSGSLAFSDTFIGALNRAAGENVGTYAIGQNTLSLGPNYLLSFVGDDFTIAQRPVTVTVDAGQHKTYGASDPATFTYSI